MSEFKQQLWSMDMLPKDILIEKIKRLEQALEEIKEIVCLELAYGTNEEYANFYMRQREAILQKISEVIDD